MAKQTRVCTLQGRMGTGVAGAVCQTERNLLPEQRRVLFAGKSIEGSCRTSIHSEEQPFGDLRPEFVLYRIEENALPTLLLFVGQRFTVLIFSNACLPGEFVEIWAPLGSVDRLKHLLHRREATFRFPSLLSFLLQSPN